MVQLWVEPVCFIYSMRVYFIAVLRVCTQDMSIQPLCGAILCFSLPFLKSVLAGEFVPLFNEILKYKACS